MSGILAMDVGDENVVAVLDLVVKTVIKVGIIVCYPPIRLAHTLERIAIFINDFFDKDRETTSVACMNLCSCYVFRLALDFRFGAACQTLRGTSRHLNLFRLPVNLTVVFAEPGEAEDHALLAQRGDCELGSLCMAFVMQDDICDLGDGACFIRSSIDVVDRDRSGEAMGGDVVRVDILHVDKKAGGTAVDKHIHIALYFHVSRLNVDVDVKRVFAWGRCDDKCLWQLTFPIGKSNSHYFLEGEKGFGHDFRTFEYACNILTLIYY
jgi:hypothetical protein